MKRAILILILLLAFAPYSNSTEKLFLEISAKQSLVGKTIKDIRFTQDGEMIIIVDGGRFEYKPEIYIKQQLIPQGKLIRNDNSQVNYDGSSLDLKR